jgi:hypothetical protein
MYDPQLPLILEIKGRVTPKIGFAGEISPDLFTVDFAGAAKFNVVLKNRPGKAPVIKLEYDGATYASEPFEKKFIDDVFATQVVKDVFEKLELDVLEPLLEGLGNIYYFDKPDNEKPGHDQYPISLQKMRGGTDSRNAIVLFIGTPGTNLNTQNLQNSIVPLYAEFMMHAGPETVEFMKEKGKAKIEEFIKDFSSVVLSDYTLSVENNQVDIYAKITETNTGSYATIDGFFHFKHVPGMEVMFMDGSDIDIDIELPWWLDLIAAFIPPIGEKIRYIEQQVPDIMQKTISELVNNFMSKLDDSIQLEGIEVGSLPVEIYPQEIKLDDNSITANVQILCWPLTADLVRADYGVVFDRFMYFVLEGGREFYADDLARLMEMGLVIVPGYHQVSGKYIRSNPDGSESNNLEYRFGR